MSSNNPLVSLENRIGERFHKFSEDAPNTSPEKIDVSFSAVRSEVTALL